MVQKLPEKEAKRLIHSSGKYRYFLEKDVQIQALSLARTGRKNN